MRRQWLVLFAGVAFLWVSGADALDLSAYRYRRDVINPHDREELAAVVLDGTLWEVLQPGAADLRVVAEASEQAVPYVLRRAMRHERRTTRVDVAARIEAFKPLPGNEAELTLAAPAKAPPIDGIVFYTPLQNYERELSVWGVRPDGSEELLAADALIYDYSRFVDVRFNEVALSSNRFQRFRVRFKEVTDQAQSPRRQIEQTFEGGHDVRRTETTQVDTRPFRIDRVGLFHLRPTAREAVPRRADRSPRAWSVRPGEDGRTTIVDIETFNEPLTALVLSSEARNFSRQATVQVPGREGVRTSWRTLAQGRLTCIAFREFLREGMRLSFEETRSPRYRVVIENQDAPPVSVTGVMGRGPVWHAVFMAAPAVRYTVVYGGADVAAPAYDTAALQQVLQQDYVPVELGLTAQTDNPAFRKRGPGLRGLLNSRVFLVGVAVIMVAVLAFALVRGVRQMEGAPGSPNDERPKPEGNSKPE